MAFVGLAGWNGEQSKSDPGIPSEWTRAPPRRPLSIQIKNRNQKTDI